MVAGGWAWWPALAHLLFVAVAVLDARRRLPGVLGESLFWGLATMSCYYVGTTLGRGGGGDGGGDFDTSARAQQHHCENDTDSADMSKGRNSPNTSPLTPREQRNGLQILVARWGTSRKEVDVTDKVQQMVQELSLIHI